MYVAGQRKYDRVRSIAYKHRPSVILVFDVTRPSSFQSIVDHVRSFPAILVPLLTSHSPIHLFALPHVQWYHEITYHLQQQQQSAGTATAQQQPPPFIALVGTHVDQRTLSSDHIQPREVRAYICANIHFVFFLFAPCSECSCVHVCLYVCLILSVTGGPQAQEMAAALGAACYVECSCVGEQSESVREAFRRLVGRHPAVQAHVGACALCLSFVDALSKCVMLSRSFLSE